MTAVMCLQHAATHCNTLQHTATLTATLCDTMHSDCARLTQHHERLLAQRKQHEDKHYATALAELQQVAILKS